MHKASSIRLDPRIAAGGHYGICSYHDYGNRDTEKGLDRSRVAGALAEDGCHHEVVNGELLMSPKNNCCHGRFRM